jgi:hypothetical protein
MPRLQKKRDMTQENNDPMYREFRRTNPVGGDMRTPEEIQRMRELAMHRETHKKPWYLKTSNYNVFKKYL